MNETGSRELIIRMELERAHDLSKSMLKWLGNLENRLSFVSVSVPNANSKEGIAIAAGNEGGEPSTSLAIEISMINKRMGSALELIGSIMERLAF